MVAQRWISALRVCLFIALLLTACTPARPTPLQIVSLKVLALPYLSFSPLFIAQEEGYFTEQSLEVEFIKLSGSEEALPVLAKGELDVSGGVISTALLNAIAQGTKIKAVADLGYLAADGCTYSAFVARRTLVEEGKLENPAQLKGRIVVVQQIASMDGFRVEKLLELGGLTLEDIQPVALSSPAQLDAFGKGTIDLTSTSEPWVTRLVNTGHAVLWKAVQEVLPDFQHAFIVYGPSILEKNPDAGRRFMVAYLKALRQYRQGKTERNLEILAKYTGLDKELLKQACWPSYHDDGRINVQNVFAFQDWAVKKGYLDKPVTEEQLWDPSFVEYANKVLSTGRK